jgi:hypothetical protein
MPVRNWGVHQNPRGMDMRHDVHEVDTLKEGALSTCRALVSPR